MKLVMENFGCFDKAELEMPNGLHLIHGQNGQGKSTLACAISWLLYNYNDKLDSKQNISSVIKRGQSYCKVSFDSWYRYRDKTKNETNIKDVSKLTPISYDIYRQIVHVNFATSILQMTSGKKNNLLSTLSDSDVINDCANKLKKDCTELQTIYNQYVKEMYEIQGVVKEFTGIPNNEYKDFSVEDMNIKISDVQNIINDYQENRNKLVAEKNHTSHVINILNNNKLCPNCLQSIEDNYKNIQVDKLNDEMGVLHNRIQVLNLNIESNIKQLYNLELNLGNYSKWCKVQDKIALLTEIETKIKKLDKEIDIHKKWYEFFSSSGSKGAKASLANTYIKYLEEYIRNLQNIFDFNLILNWEDDVLSILIDNIPYELQGNGIKRRLDILLSLALRQLVIYLKGDLGICNFLVLDELFNNLDTKGIEDTLELLKVLNISYPTYVISPRYVDFEWNSTIEVKNGKILEESKV